jgi:hypothetical protein
MYNVDGGVNMPPGSAAIYYYNNIIANRTNPRAFDLYREGTKPALDEKNNIFGANARFAGTDQGANAFLGDPKLALSGGNDFRPQSTSAAIDKGISSTVYSVFQSRYGISIAVDFDGKPRPAGAGWDIGAFEAAATAAP